MFFHYQCKFTFSFSIVQTARKKKTLLRARLARVHHVYYLYGVLWRFYLYGVVELWRFYLYGVVELWRFYLYGVVELWSGVYLCGVVELWSNGGFISTELWRCGVFISVALWRGGCNTPQPV